MGGALWTSICKRVGRQSWLDTEIGTETLAFPVGISGAHLALLLVLAVRRLWICALLYPGNLGYRLPQASDADLGGQLSCR